jgi:hypothetical protein
VDDRQPEVREKLLMERRIAGVAVDRRAAHPIVLYGLIAPIASNTSTNLAHLRLIAVNSRMIDTLQYK